MRKISFLIIAITILFGCVYFNTFFNAKKYFAEAENAKKKNKGKLTGTIHSKYDKAIEKCAKVISNYPKSRYVEDAVLLMGKAFLGKEEYYKAAQKFEEFIEFYPDSKSIPEAKLLLARTYYKQKKFEEARTELDNIIADNSLSSIHFSAHYFLTQYYYEQKEYVLAIQNLKKILVKKNQKNKLYFPAFFQLGKLYFENHQYNESLETFHNLLSAKPDKRTQLDTEFYIGKIYIATGQHKKALSILKKLRSNETDDRNIYSIGIQIGICHLEQENFDEASKEFNNIIDNNKKNEFSAEAYYYLGEMYFTYIQDYKKAIENFDNVRKEYKDSPYVEEALRKGSIASQIVQYKEADKKTDIASLVDMQFQLAEYYTLDLNMPDSALTLYDEIYEQYNNILTKLDSINSLFDSLKTSSTGFLDSSKSIEPDSMKISTIFDSLTDTSQPKFNPSEKSVKSEPVDSLENIVPGSNKSEKIIHTAKVDTVSLSQQRESLNNLVETYQTDIIPKSLFLKAWIWLKVKNDTVKADSIIQELKTTFPESKYSFAGEQLLSGKESQFITKQNLEAKSYFEKVENYFLNPDSLEVEKIIRYLDTILQNYPESDYYPKALYSKGYLLLTVKNDTVYSKVYFRELQENFAEDELALKTQSFFNGETYLFPEEEIEEQEATIPDSSYNLIPAYPEEDTLLDNKDTSLPDTIETIRDTVDQSVEDTLLENENASLPDTIETIKDSVNNTKD